MALNLVKNIADATSGAVEKAAAAVQQKDPPKPDDSVGVAKVLVDVTDGWNPLPRGWSAILTLFLGLFAFQQISLHLFPWLGRLSLKLSNFLTGFNYHVVSGLDSYVWAVPTFSAILWSIIVYRYRILSRHPILIFFVLLQIGFLSIPIAARLDNCQAMNTFDADIVNAQYSLETLNTRYSNQDPKAEDRVTPQQLKEAQTRLDKATKTRDNVSQEKLEKAGRVVVCRRPKSIQLPKP